MTDNPTPGDTAPAAPDDARSAEDRIVDAFMDLLGRRAWGDVALFDIAESAGVSMADLRETFGTRTAILRAFSRRIDAAVLAEIAGDGEMEEEPRERLFDVLMTRFEHLKDHRPALRHARDHAREDAGFALKMGAQALVTASWMLEAAGLSSAGADGRRRVMGLPGVWASAFDAFLKDDDPGLARTMARLDRRLRRAEELDARLAKATRRWRDVARDLAQLGRDLERAVATRSSRRGGEAV